MAVWLSYFNKSTLKSLSKRNSHIPLIGYLSLLDVHMLHQELYIYWANYFNKCLFQFIRFGNIQDLLGFTSNVIIDM